MLFTTVKVTATPPVLAVPLVGLTVSHSGTVATSMAKAVFGVLAATERLAPPVMAELPPLM